MPWSARKPRGLGAERSAARSRDGAAVNGKLRGRALCAEQAANLARGGPGVSKASHPKHCGASVLVWFF